MRVPRSAWLATGAAVTAGWAWAGQSAVAALVAGLLVLAVGLAARPSGVRGAVPLLAGGTGATLLALRVLLGPAAPPVAPLPDGSGPWTAVVESVGSPRDGDQVARLLLRVEPGVQPEPVRVAATLPAFPAVRAGDTLEVRGRLRPPPDDDGYGEYLRRTGAAGSLDATSVAVLAPPAGLSLQPMRDAAGDALRVALPEPEAGLAAGILIGLRERVDRSLAADFATAGASHVVAISGWNIAIVAGSRRGDDARPLATPRRDRGRRHDPRLRAGGRGVAVGGPGGGDGGRRAARPRVGPGRSGTGGTRAGRVRDARRRAGDDR